jgi:ABC-2 type transport system ATP-binding protein
MSDGRAAEGESRQTEIRVEGLAKAFGRREVLRDVSFTVPRGGFLAVFGPNGAGKTTTLRLVATLLRPSSGSVSVAGHDLKDDPTPVRRARATRRRSAPKGSARPSAGARCCAT